MAVMWNLPFITCAISDPSIP